jgi:predicted phosphodiesterase
MKIGIISDVHANLPALQAVIRRFQGNGVDSIIHLGDAIAIGPQPRECLELLRSIPEARFIMGNHDYWYANGLPDPLPDWMTEGELRHQHWTHEQLGEEFKDWIKSWPWNIIIDVQDIRLAFLHCPLKEDAKGSKNFVLDPKPEDFDQYFDYQATYYFFGHVHTASDLQGKARYMNPGSLGCQKEAIAPYFILEIIDDHVRVHKNSVGYDDGPLFKAFETRKVPERDFIYKAFFGGRFQIGDEG